MGPTRARAILGAIERHRARSGRMLLHRALEHAEAMLERLRTVPGVLRAEAAGSLRRRKETVGDIDLLVAANDAEPAVRAFTQLSGVSSVLAEGASVPDGATLNGARVFADRPSSSGERSGRAQPMG